MRIKADNSIGSGTVIAVEEGKAIVLTAHHVVGSARTVTVDFPFRPVQGRVIANGGAIDLAAIEVDAPSWITCVPVADSPPPNGSHVTQVGFPHGWGPVTRSGQIHGTAGAIAGSQVNGYSFDIQPGDSGSGAFNDDGQLVGVCNWGGTGQCLSVSVRDINAFISQRCQPLFPNLFKRLRHPANPPGTVPVTPIPPAPAPVDLGGVHAKLDKILSAIEGQAPVGGKVAQALDGLQKQVQSHGGIVAALPDKIKSQLEALPNNGPALQRIEQLAADAKNNAGAVLPQVKAALAAHAPEIKAALGEVIAAEAPKLLAAAPAIGAGVLGGPPGWIALGLGGLATVLGGIGAWNSRRKPVTVGSGNPITGGAGIDAGTVLNLIRNELAGRNVTVNPSGAPVIQKAQSPGNTFVQVPANDVLGEAYRQAVALAKGKPVAGELIEAWKDQILAGLTAGSKGTP